MSEDDIRKNATEIVELLKKSHSLLPEQDEEDDGEEVCFDGEEEDDLSIDA